MGRKRETCERSYGQEERGSGEGREGLFWQDDRLKGFAAHRQQHRTRELVNGKKKERQYNDAISAKEKPAPESRMCVRVYLVARDKGNGRLEGKRLAVGAPRKGGKEKGSESAK